jgi:hypothetical protein
MTEGITEDLVPLPETGASEVIALYRHISRAFDYQVKRRPPWVKGWDRIQDYNEYLEQLYSPEHKGAILSMPPEDVGWLELDAVSRSSLQEFLEVWVSIQAAARADLASGHAGASAVLLAERSSPWDLAKYLARREAMMREWQPRNGIEETLIDMLCQAHAAYSRWMLVLSFRTGWPARELTEDEVKWELPRQDEAQALAQAAEMADRFNRMFMRTLRQLQDLRKSASAVVVQQAGQVNVGQQQVNVAQSAGTGEGSW